MTTTTAIETAEAKVREIFAALVGGTTEYGPADLENAAGELFRAGSAANDRKALARGESMIWNAIALGSRRESAR